MIDLDHLSHILQQDCRLDPTKLVIIGVSGGPDSLCLLDLMCRLKYPLVVAHLNHGLRSEADEDAQVVREAARNRGVDFILKEADIADFAQSHSLSIEEAARKVRYQFLFDHARQREAQAVAVAHTADDQIETVLMHLLRGSGLSGLKGMNYLALPNLWDQTIALIRPLLGIYREEILAYCAGQCITPVFDRSNLDPTFFRNRIRSELIPLLGTYNSGIKSNLWRMSQILAGDHQALETLTDSAWVDCCLEQGDQGVALKITHLATQPEGVQRRLVRRAIAILRPGLRDIDYATIEKTLDFIHTTVRNAQWDLSNGLRMLREGDMLWIANWVGELSAGIAPQIEKITYNLSIPGNVDLPGGWHIQAWRAEKTVDSMNQAMKNTDLFQAWIDISEETTHLLVRSPLPGDRFKPLGMDGHTIKLSDFFINVKVPRRLRRFWPLVCLDNKIAWIPGYRISHSFRLAEGVKQAVHLRLYKD